MEPTSQRFLLGVAGASGEEYWIKYRSVTNPVPPGGIIIDSNNHIVGSGWRYSGSASIYYPWHWKVNKKGETIYSLECNDYPSPTGYESAFVTQLPNGGDYIFTNGPWRTRRSIDFTEVTRQSGLGGGLITDDSGNSYGGLYSINSSLGLRWGAASTSAHIARRTDGNLVFAGTTPSNPGAGTMTVVNSSSGSLVTAYKTSDSGSNHYAKTVATDKSGNMYWAGGYSTLSYGMLVYKLNSSGSLVWYYYKYSFGAANPGAIAGLGIDDEGNVYCWTAYSYLVKLNSSGTPQWAVNIAGASVTPQDIANSFKVAGSSIYITTRHCLLKLPLDVTRVPDGTYGPATFTKVTSSIASETLSTSSWTSFSTSLPSYSTPTIGSQYGSFADGPSSTWSIVDLI